MYKKHFFSVILAVLLSFSILCINVSAFDFDGDTRTHKDIYSDWFNNIKDFCTGQKDYESFVNGNLRFQTDIVASCLYPGSSEELYDRVNSLQEQLRTAYESTDNKVDDSFLRIFGEVVEGVGLVDFRQQFEQWYQDKYGKEYGKHELPFDRIDDLKDFTGNYYIYSHNQGYEYKIFFSYNGSAITVSETAQGYQYFMGTQLGSIHYRSYTRTQYYDGSWSDWQGGKDYTGGVSGKYYLNLDGLSGTSMTVDSTNLPLKFGDDVTGGDPVTDWDSELGGELVAPSITLPEIGDLLTDLDEDLKNSDTDTDNPNKGVEKKITQLTNKLHNDLSKVIDYLKKILDKLIEFFNKFIDNFDNFFDRLDEFFQSVFVPQDDYFNNAIMDIKAEFDEAFSFAGDLRLIVDSCINSYKSGGTRAPEIEISVDGYGSPRKLDFSIFDKSISLVRSVICAICYASFALSTYRRIPLYISGGGDK